MITTYETLTLMISFSLLVLAIVNTIVDIIFRLLDIMNVVEIKKNTKK